MENQAGHLGPGSGRSQSFIPDAKGNFSSVANKGVTQTRPIKEQNEIRFANG